MNKKLLAMAVGAALVAGSTLVAQAEVKLYGHAHMSLDNLERDLAVGTSDQGEWFLSPNSSRIGIRSTEDLGGGLKGVAQFEFLYNQDANAAANTAFNNRDNYIGLEGGFGALRIGVIDTTTKDTGGIADLFYREQLGESRAIINVGGMDGRVNNGIHYLSPNMSGLEFKAQYGVEDSFATDATVMALGARWTAGPLVVGASYLNVEAAAAGAPDQKGMRLAAKFDVGGGFTVAALWQNVDDIGNVSGTDRDAMGIGASFKAGNNIFKAQYYEIDKADNSAAENGANQISLGFDHLFSKTVKGYVTYAMTENDSGGQAFGIGGNGHGNSAAPTINGGEATGFSLGMIVDF